MVMVDTIAMAKNTLLQVLDEDLNVSDETEALFFLCILMALELGRQSIHYWRNWAVVVLFV